MSAKTETSPVDLLDQATQTFFGTLSNGLRLQKELTLGWVELMRKTRAVDWPQEMQQTIKETLPLAKKQAYETLKAVEQSSRFGLEVLSETFDLSKSQNLGETQARWERLWQSSVATMRTNTQALVQSNADLLESWMGVAKRNTERAAAAATAQ